MPDRPGNFSIDYFQGDKRKALQAFGGDRSPVFYDKNLQDAHHIHFRGDGMYRVLQHHYGKQIRRVIYMMYNPYLFADFSLYLFTLCI